MASQTAIESVQASLQQAVEDAQIRSTIEASMREMVADIELANRLEEKLKMSQEIQRLKKQLVEHEWAVEEARVVQQDREEQQANLGDRFVQDIWSLNQKLGELRSIKKRHESLLIQHDEVVAKLAQAEEDLLAAREGHGLQVTQSVSADLTAESDPDTTLETNEVGKASTSAPRSPKVSSVTTPVQTSTPANIEATATVVVLPPTPKAKTTDNAEVDTPKETLAKEGTEDKSPEEKGADYQKVVGAGSQEEPEGGTAPAVSLHEEPEAGTTAAVSLQEEPEAGTTAAVSLEGKPEAGTTAAVSLEEKPEAGTTAAVSLEEDSEPEPPTLEALETKILMQIFAYLDALDILNTAQVNVSMYSRVDSLFGLGGGDAATDGDNSTIATVETGPPAVPVAPTPVTAPPSGYPAQPRLSVPSSAVGTVTTSATTPTTTTASSPVIPFRRSGSNPIASTSTTSIASEGIRSFFNMLQPARAKLAPPSPPRFSSSPARSPIRRTGSPSSENPPMNAAMASSMASKLTDAELNAIILMTERLRQKEALAEKLIQERQDLDAKLDGTESVKQFLIAKVREMEESLSLQEDNETKVAQQIASDQEVIAFLDGRVQKLEAEAATLQKEKEELREETKRVREQASQKAVVMGDMLQYERERWKGSEREWKATKKVLVKEVKHCRAQIAALQAERDGYREQNDVLRKAIVSTPLSSNAHREHAFA